MRIEIKLPFPPSLNTLYKSWRGRMIMSKEGKAYKTEVFWLCKQNKVKPILGSISLDVLAYPPDNRKRDLDNLLKILLDSLKGGVAFEDDSDICKLSILKCEKSEVGFVVVVIEGRS